LKVAIVGAGIAGLASAVRMAVKGHVVEVYEKEAKPGGKLSSLQVGAYRFDLGPSLFTMPQYVDELFALAGEDPREYFRYHRLPVICNYFWEDGTRLHAYAEKEAFAREAEDKLGVRAGKVLQLLQQAETKYKLTGRTFLEKSLHRADTWLDPSVLWALLQLPRFDLFTTMHSVHARALDNPKMVQLFNRFATYNGSNPYKAPGLLSIIPHFEHHYGAYLPEGGMVAITERIHALAERLGVKFHFNQSVEEILVSDGRASGLRVQGQSLDFERVICNMDVFFAYHKLLPAAKKPERVLRQQKSTSALIFYWGIKKTFPELNVHNIFFSDNYQAEFAALEAGGMHEDPTVYVNLTSRHVQGDAPEGCENWFVMINAPYDRGQDWEELTRLTRARTLEKLSRLLGTDVSALIEAEYILTPPTIESRTGSHLGALYGTSSNNRMAAFLRHANFSSDIRELYFAGGSVHPGGGIPLCLLSARIVDECCSS